MISMRRTAAVFLPPSWQGGAGTRLLTILGQRDESVAQAFFQRAVDGGSRAVAQYAHACLVEISQVHELRAQVERLGPVNRSY